MVAYGMHRYDMSTYFSGLTSVHTLGAILQMACGVGTSYALAFASFHLFESPFLSLKRWFDNKDRSALAQTARRMTAGAAT
jgi:peptidoglycan/LPS O-acetylase OafA/YrhL